jgi:hypothetical protein
MKSNMSERIMKLVKRDPSLSLKALCKLVNLRSTSNVFYHIQRLEKAGLVHWTGSRKHINHSERAMQKHKNGLIALRRSARGTQRRRQPQGPAQRHQSDRAPTRVMGIPGTSASLMVVVVPYSYPQHSPCQLLPRFPWISPSYP